MKKNIILMISSVVLAAAVGLLLSFSVLTLQDSMEFFSEVDETKAYIDDFFSTMDSENYQFWTGYLKSAETFGLENEQQVIELAEEELSDCESYVGVLYRQADFGGITFVPKDSAAASAQTYSADESGLVDDDCYFTSEPLIMEDTYLSMDIYTEIDKDIMCETYTVSEQIPIYVSAEVAQTYGLDTYVDGVISIYNDETEEYETITLNCKVAGVIDEPSFTMNHSGTDITWEIALPLITSDDGSYLVYNESASRTFVFTAYTVEDIEEINDMVSKYFSYFETLSYGSIPVVSAYENQSENYGYYFIERSLSIAVLILASVLAVVIFGLIYRQLFKSEEGRTPVKVLCAIVSFLLVPVMFVVNTSIEISDERFAGVAVAVSNGFTHLLSGFGAAFSVALLAALFALGLWLVQKKRG